MEELNSKWKEWKLGKERKGGRKEGKQIRWDAAGFGIASWKWVFRVTRWPVGAYGFGLNKTSTTTNGDEWRRTLDFVLSLFSLHSEGSVSSVILKNC